MLSGDRCFSGLLARVWCPICGSSLKVELVEDGSGAKRLVCPVHGEMRTFLDRDPLAAVARACDGRGIVDLEAGAEATAAIAEASFEGAKS